MKRCSSQESEKRAQELEIYIPPGPRLGQIVIEAEGVSKAYGDELLFEDMNFRLPPGGIVGVIGPNGAGKTTLFRMITGAGKAGCGTIRSGRDREAGLRRSEPRRADAGQDRVGRDLRRARYRPARHARGEFARLRRAIQFFRQPISRRRSASFPAASETAFIWRKC